MYEDHPINGVGVNDFRFAYPNYALPNDPFVHLESQDEEIGALHAHNIWLGIADETGTVGLIGAVGFAAVLIVLWRRTPLPAQREALPWALALLALLFPFNTHVAAYSLLMSALLWLLVALYCAACENGMADGGGRAYPLQGSRAGSI
jgi:O-antigen ligase